MPRRAHTSGRERAINSYYLYVRSTTALMLLFLLTRVYTHTHIYIKRLAYIDINVFPIIIQVLMLEKNRIM